jgi:uncharacterized protein YjbJ (UPF0337 family)
VILGDTSNVDDLVQVDVLDSMSSTSTTASVGHWERERGVALCQRQYVLGRDGRAGQSVAALCAEHSTVRREAKEQWGKLSDDDWTMIAGKRDQLVGKIQERYGVARDEAERQVKEYESTYEQV